MQTPGLPGVVGGGTVGGADNAALRPPPPLLPFGPTLHYTGCGCPYNWASGCRLCDWGDSWLAAAHSGLRAGPPPARKLKVAYCLPHHNVTGGLKVMLEQMRLLQQRGHTVVALTRSELAQRAVPPWSNVRADADVVCRAAQRFRDAYDVDSCDAVVVGIYHQIPEWLAGTSAPVLYYEQGHEMLFGDPARFSEAGSARAQDTLFHMALHLPVALAAVSEAVQSIMCREFGRSSLLVHNCVDCARFSPGPPAAELLAAPSLVLTSRAHAPPAPGEARPSVLLVGNPALALKGFDCALAALGAVHRERPIEVHWVCQQPPCARLQALVDAAGLRVSLHVDPPQGALPRLYRGHAAFLFTSQYEAWGMPVLEAMASGLAVVATETAGVGSFATHSLDCLMAPVGDAAELAAALLSVLEDGRLAARLAAAARQTALAFTPARVADQLEAALHGVAACRQELVALRLQALPDTQAAAAMAARACAGVAAEQQAQKRARQRPQEEQPGSAPAHAHAEAELRRHSQQTEPGTRHRGSEEEVQQQQQQPASPQRQQQQPASPQQQQQKQPPAQQRQPGSPQRASAAPQPEQAASQGRASPGPAVLPRRPSVSQADEATSCEAASSEEVSCEVACDHGRKRSPSRAFASPPDD